MRPLEASPRFMLVSSYNRFLLQGPGGFDLNAGVVQAKLAVVFEFRSKVIKQRDVLLARDRLVARVHRIGGSQSLDGSKHGLNALETDSADQFRQSNTFKTCIVTVSYTHLTLPTNREV